MRNSKINDGLLKVLFLGASDCYVASLASEFIAHLKRASSKDTIYDIHLNFFEDSQGPIFSFLPFNSTREIKFSILQGEKDYYYDEIECNEDCSFLSLLKQIQPDVPIIFLKVPISGYNGLLDRLVWYFKECKKIYANPIFYLMGIEKVQSETILEWIHKTKCQYNDFLFLLSFKRHSLPEFVVTSSSEQIKITCNQLRYFNTMHNLHLENINKFSEMFMCSSPALIIHKQLMYSICRLILSKDRFFSYYFENNNIS